MRNRLQNRTIMVIAESGLDKTSTSAIVKNTGINEAYIYRCFQNKEDLLSHVFDQLDEELCAMLKVHLPLVHLQELDPEVRWRLLFDATWRFLLGNREKCLAYVRYYYSPYFTRYSAVTHRRRYAPVLAELKRVFKRGTDVGLVLNHGLTSMLDFAVRVHIGQVSNVDRYAERAFRVLYASVKQCLRKQRKAAV